jgi:hypothetical protein
VRGRGGNEMVWLEKDRDLFGILDGGYALDAGSPSCLPSDPWQDGYFSRAHFSPVFVSYIMILSSLERHYNLN